MSHFFNTFIALIAAIIFVHFSATVYVSVRKNHTFGEAAEQILRDLNQVTQRDSEG